jgi:hypothetical protein
VGDIARIMYVILGREILQVHATGMGGYCIYLCNAWRSLHVLGGDVRNTSRFGGSQVIPAVLVSGRKSKTIRSGGLQETPAPLVNVHRKVCRLQVELPPEGRELKLTQEIWRLLVTQEYLEVKSNIGLVTEGVETCKQHQQFL